jgi:hypothetical protein
MSETHLIPSSDLYAAPLPSDGTDLFRQLSEAVAQTLQPGTQYEAYIAGQVAELDVEINRHRRMRNALIMNQLGAEVVAALTGYRPSGSKSIDLPDIRAAHDPRTSEARTLAAHLISGDPERRAAAMSELSAKGIDLELLTARAFQNATGQASHDDAIERLEVRRRRILRDFGMLVDGRASQAKQVS